MTGRIFLKVLLVFSALLGVAAVGIDYLATRIVESNLRSEMERGLLEKARLADAALRRYPRPNDPAAVKEIAQATGARLTLIDRSGVVLGDSQADPAAMENHLSRPEFVEALAGRAGVSRRFSRTLGIDFLYVAIPTGAGALRLALPLSQIQVQISSIRSRILTVTLLALAPAVLLAAWLARRVSDRLSRLILFSRRLAEGEFRAPGPPPSRGELGELGTTLAVTAQKLQAMFEELQNERSRFAAAVDGIGEGVLVVDRDQRVILSNPALRAMFPGQQLLPGSTLHGWPQTEVVELFMHVFRQGSSDAIQVNVTAPAERTWRVSCAPVANPSGKAQAAVAVFYDITELEKLERIRKDFVINVSHELRTPLASIQGYTETLLDGAIDDPANNRRFLAIIRQNAERLARLTADLMALSQIEIKAREFQFVLTPLAELFHEALDAIRSLTEKKGTVIGLDPLPEGVEAELDAEAIHQVLVNLLDNAVKYTPEGGSVTLGARLLGTEVEFYVRDTGIGIPAEEIPRLFERFYRVDKARSRALGGTGLGLAIVKHLVRAHDGSVRVESQLGVGSTFYVRLPLSRRGAGVSRLAQAEAVRAT